MKRKGSQTTPAPTEDTVQEGVRRATSIEERVRAEAELAYLAAVKDLARAAGALMNLSAADDPRRIAASRAWRAASLLHGLLIDVLAKQHVDAALVEKADKALAVLLGVESVDEQVALFDLLVAIELAADAAEKGHGGMVQSLFDSFAARYPLQASRIDRAAIETAAKAWPAGKRTRFVAAAELAAAAGVLPPSATWESVEATWSRGRAKATGGK